MADPAGAIGAVERIAQSDAGRNIGALAEAAVGGLESAARSLLSAERVSVAILTGAYITSADPPAAETDGPPGAAMVGAALRAMGGDARLVTDPPCAPVVRSLAEAVDLPLEVAGASTEVDRLGQRLGEDGITHVISIERLGPAADGEVHNMHGEPITEHTAPLHELLQGGSWTTIAIGDGGNEIGMGVLPKSLVASEVEHGDLIHCVVPADHLIVSGVSNWGAVALLVSLGLLAPSYAPLLMPIASAEEHERLVRVAVDGGGAVDGTSGSRTATVDGLPIDHHTQVMRSMTAQIGRNTTLRGT